MADIVEHVRSCRDARCAEILRYIVAVKRARNGWSPSYGDIARATGLTSKNTVKFHLDHLAADGLIVLHPGYGNCIEVVGSSWVPYDAMSEMERLREENKSLLAREMLAVGRYNELNKAYKSLEIRIALGEG